MAPSTALGRLLKAAGSGSDEYSPFDRLPHDHGPRRDGWHRMMHFHDNVELCCAQLAEHGQSTYSHGTTTGDVIQARGMKRDHAACHRGDRGGQIRLSATRESERQRCSAVTRLDLFDVHIAPTVGTTGRVI